MASIFGHALASVAIGSNFPKTLKNIQFWLLGMFCAIFPDSDVIGFKLGIKYESFLDIEALHIRLFLRYFLVF